MLRSAWFLASAVDTRKSPAERSAAWKCAELEAWFEAVVYRGLPILCAPLDHIARIRALVFERHEGPISGTQLRR